MVYLPRKLSRKYRIARDAPLGRGQYGSVWLAKDRETHELVAIKIVPIEGKDTSTRIKREIAALQALDHPCIVKLLSACKGSKAWYIVTEYVSGGELYNYLVNNIMSEHDISVVFESLMEGVAYLHHKGVVHCDLKLENVLLVDAKDATKGVKICDFGSAIFADDNENTKKKRNHITMGTPQYLAPELLEGKRQSYASDVWSTGVILYTLLSGTYPFDADHPSALYFKIMTGKADFNKYRWKNVSSSASGLVQELLCAHENMRPSARKVLLHPWMVHNGPQALVSKTVPAQVNQPETITLKTTHVTRPTFLSVLSRWRASPVNVKVAAESSASKQGQRKKGMKALEDETKGHVAKVDEQSAEAVLEDMMSDDRSSHTSSGAETETSVFSAEREHGRSFVKRLLGRIRFSHSARSHM
eukprot:Colp12_sorted_trinity150504_noHs@19314